MRILLVGEFSRLHNSLKEGLEQLGHEVVIIGDGDGFKDYPVDIKLKHQFVKGPLNILRKMLHRFFGIDLKSLSIQRQFNAQKPNLKGYDIVQLINEKAFNTIPKIEEQLLKFIFENNDKVFLLSCGCDFPSVDYAMKKKFKYSILTPYFNGKISKKDFYPVLMYLQEAQKSLHQFIYSRINGVIASDMDYHLPLEGHSKYLGLIPNPVNTDIIHYIPPVKTDKIIIFHGINSAHYFKKGNDLFEKALLKIEQEFKDQVEIITTTDIPYDEYIELYNRAHIVMDQVYAYDQGYNALEAMAKGKVVFTGAEQEWLDFYDLEPNSVAINAEPDVQQLVKQLAWLITNPDAIDTISKQARAFIEKEHDYIKIAKTYVTKWSEN
ncbi:MAG: glycosyltransferase [Algicola sp.]|nr:glycosyltransferase [Algicola sp.]